jgi:hypothetical protein
MSEVMSDGLAPSERAAGEKIMPLAWIAATLLLIAAAWGVWSLAQPTTLTVAPGASLTTLMPDKSWQEIVDVAEEAGVPLQLSSRTPISYEAARGFTPEDLDHTGIRVLVYEGDRFTKSWMFGRWTFHPAADRYEVSVDIGSPTRVK